MDKTLRNTFIGVIATIIVAFVGAWIDINTKIAILQAQVENDHQAIAQTNQDIDEMKTMLQEIQVGVQHLQDVKKDK